MKYLTIVVICSIMVGCAPFLYLAQKQCKDENPCTGPKVKILEW